VINQRLILLFDYRRFPLLMPSGDFECCTQFKGISPSNDKYGRQGLSAALLSHDEPQQANVHHGRHTFPTAALPGESCQLHLHCPTFGGSSFNLQPQHLLRGISTINIIVAASADGGCEIISDRSGRRAQKPQCGPPYVLS
jgi:hypothetical protein